MARSTFYYHLKSLRSVDKYAQLKVVIKNIFEDNRGRYGYRRIAIELKERGYTINHKTVLRLMNICGLKCKVRAKKYRSYRGDVGLTAPNIINRNFKADKPNQKWATDVTEFKINGVKLYLSPIIDLYNSEIISYNISDRPIFNQTIDMLNKAFSTIEDNTRKIKVGNI